MKKFVIALLAVMLVTGAVYASEKPALEKPVLPVDMNVDLNENEPNDDCTMADYITADDNYSAAIDPAGDVDWFEVFYPDGGMVTFETHPGDANDTKMYLYADDCVTELAYNDDGGVGYYSLIEYDLAPGTTYYVVVTGYSSSTQGTYFLTMAVADPPCPAPENNTCDGALALNFGEAITFNNCGATNDYSAPSGGCTGYTSEGLDVVYYVDLVENQQFTVSAQTDYDIAIYLVSDCADIENTCVAGSDNTVSEGFEEIIFDAADAPGRYYLILDGYSSSGIEGDWTVTTDGVVPTSSTSFDGLKSMYR
jgi:hypothetical protein